MGGRLQPRAAPKVTPLDFRGIEGMARRLSNVAVPPYSSLPGRKPGSPTGSEFIQQVMDMKPGEREEAILRELRNGNIPDFLRTTVPVTVQLKGEDGTVLHTVTYSVLPDYLAIGTNADHVIVPMTPAVAELFARENGYTLPTSKMVDDIYGNAALRLPAESRQYAGTKNADLQSSPEAYQEHDEACRENYRRAMEEAYRNDPIPHLGSDPRPTERGSLEGILAAGHKKDLVITDYVNAAGNNGELAFYGWHGDKGHPIQDQGSRGYADTAHEWWFADYSHGARLVEHEVTVDGKRMPITEVLKDPELAPLLSSENKNAGVKGAKPDFTMQDPHSFSLP